jgi:hypothetical protein
MHKKLRNAEGLLAEEKSVKQIPEVVEKIVHVVFKYLPRTF